MNAKEDGRAGGRQITAPRGKRPIYVWATADERDEIARHAKATGQPVSVYLRRLGLAYQPKSVLDAERVCELLKACGDLGRLGGLLKLWLADKPGEGVPEADVRALLDSISHLRDQIVEKVAAL